MTNLDLVMKQEELMAEVRQEFLKLNGVDLTDLHGESIRLMNEIKELQNNPEKFKL